MIAERTEEGRNGRPRRATIQWAPRMQALGQVVRHISEHLGVMGMIYDVAPLLIGHQLENVATPNPTWNIHRWALKG